MNKDSHINIPNETMRHYSGLIRQLQSTLSILEKRVKKLEEALTQTQHAFSSIEGITKTFADIIGGRNAIVNPDTALASKSPTVIGGLTSVQLKNLITAWITAGELPIPLHDHTDDDKGGDAYANKGAALQ